MKQKKEWYRLDNAGKLYPSITSTRVSTVFRLSATLYNNIDSKVLQIALNNIIEYFPTLKLILKEDSFGIILSTLKNIPKFKETYYPCMFMFYKNKILFLLGSYIITMD